MNHLLPVAAGHLADQGGVGAGVHCGEGTPPLVLGRSAPSNDTARGDQQTGGADRRLLLTGSPELSIGFGESRAQLRPYILPHSLGNGGWESDALAMRDRAGSAIKGLHHVNLIRRNWGKWKQTSFGGC